MYRTRNGALCEVIQPRQSRTGKVSSNKMEGKTRLLEYVYAQMHPIRACRFEWVREDNLTLEPQHTQPPSAAAPHP